ncbi:hypothetical protein BZA77DRAFT_293215 [Pyronema omphalodes]|nr:hypothetical protein BZA77DRAFT_293215 [Pyronema omphalodes]
MGVAWCSGYHTCLTHKRSPVRPWVQSLFISDNPSEYVAFVFVPEPFLPPPAFAALLRLYVIHPDLVLCLFWLGLKGLAQYKRSFPRLQNFTPRFYHHNNA